MNPNPSIHQKQNRKPETRRKRRERRERREKPEGKAKGRKVKPRALNREARKKFTRASQPIDFLRFPPQIFVLRSLRVSSFWFCLWCCLWPDLWLWFPVFPAAKIPMNPMKTLLAAVLFVILAAPAPAWQSKQKWKPYIYPDDGFSITLPSQPIPQNDQGDPHIHLYSIHLEGGAVFSLRVVHRLTDCETTLPDLWDKANANQDANEPV